MYASTIAYAIDGVEKATLEVNGLSYTFPVGGVERKADIFYLKKAINGDKEAREMFMKGREEEWFFIGDDSPLWLHVTRNSMTVVDPNKPNNKEK